MHIAIVEAVDCISSLYCRIWSRQEAVVVLDGWGQSLSPTSSTITLYFQHAAILNEEETPGRPLGQHKMALYLLFQLNFSPRTAPAAVAASRYTANSNCNTVKVSLSNHRLYSHIVVNIYRRLLCPSLWFCFLILVLLF